MRFTETSNVFGILFSLWTAFATILTFAYAAPISTVADISAQSATAIDDTTNARLPPMPIVYFRLGGPIDQKAFTTEIYNGPIRAKDRFEVIYEPTRAKCEHAFESGVDSWAVHLAYQNTANQIHPDFALAAYVDPNSNSTVNPPIIIPPMNKTGKALFWFYCTNAVGQVEYDSNMGSNWEVEIVDG